MYPLHLIAVTTRGELPDRAVIRCVNISDFNSAWDSLGVEAAQQNLQNSPCHLVDFYKNAQPL